MKLLFLLMLLVWVFSSTSFSAPADISPDPDPPLPSSAEPVIPSERNPTSLNRPSMALHSPDIKVVHHQDLNKSILIALVVASSLLGGILMLLSCFWIYRLKKLRNLNAKPELRNAKTAPSRDASSGVSLSPILYKFPSLRLSVRKGSASSIEYQLIVAATNNFHEDNLLGEGGFGCVYRARFKDDFLAAIKRIHGGGQNAAKEFENELEWLGKLDHQNIVSLLGFCLHGETRFLIYEMMHNGSLETQLHGHSNGAALTWHIRMKIALDVARGLEYLHERRSPPVIHRDLKSSNILLDSNFIAKLSDFGLATTGGSQNKSNLKLSGTLGYVAPEYLLDGKLTDKSDVYAFGVVLLELLTGKKPVEKISESQSQSIVTWAMPHLTDRSKLPNIVDPVIKDTMDLKHLYQVAAVAVLCVQPEPSYRPLITDVLHSFIPLVPVELGGSLKVAAPLASG